MAKIAPSDEKLRGGYYTPKTIGQFLAEFVIRSPFSSVLEPSCGDGNLLESAIERLIQLGVPKSEVLNFVHGIEVESVEAEKAIERIGLYGDLFSTVNIHTGDFFAYCRDNIVQNRVFDGVIGNPPFIRYQNFPEDQRRTAFEIMHKVGLKPNRLTNIWVPFVVAATLLLNEHGRIGMVIPAELLQVNYAAELRSFLSESYDYLTLVTFRRLVFSGIQQEVVLLLGERGNSRDAHIEVIELDDMNGLQLLSQNASLRTNPKSMDHSTEKWTMYFLEEDELNLLRSLKDHPGLNKVKDFVEVDVGIVTGLNEYFVLPEKQVRELDLAPYTQPIVSRSNHLQGTIFSKEDWRIAVDKQSPAFLLDFPNVPFEQLPPEIREYVIYGERRGMNQGYKCRIRKLWYVVPSIWTPDAFMLRQIHHYPKIVVNEANATCTDTIHRVRLRNGNSVRKIAVAFVNSLTFAFTETMGRSYGGGVLELEPNEAENLPLPYLGVDKLNLDEVDSYLRAGNIEAVLQVTDRVLLEEGLGLTVDDVSSLRNIWMKLRNRRLNRK